MKITCSGSSQSKCVCQQPLSTRPECSWLRLYASSGIFGSDSSNLDQFFQNRIDRRLTLSPGISGAFNALPTCDSRADHLSKGFWSSLGDMKPFRPFILGIKSHLYPWRTHLWGFLWTFFMVLHLLISDSSNHPVVILCNGQMTQWHNSNLWHIFKLMRPSCLSHYRASSEAAHTGSNFDSKHVTPLAKE